MDINLSKIKWGKVIKVSVVVLVLVSLLVATLRIAGMSVRSFGIGKGSSGYQGNELGMSAPSFNYKMADEMMVSIRNVAPPSPSEPDSVGDDSEEFEVTEYSASIETRSLEDDCRAISELKPLDYVVFESSNEQDHSCNYRFKVRNENVAEVLAVIEALDPRDFSERKFTIKSQIIDYTSETQILQAKLVSVDETLEKAVASYDELAALATKVRDVESLTKIIDSKIRIIERLTEERVMISSQLERLARAKGQQLDRIEYTYFNVSVTEDKLIDGEALRDSWKREVRQFFREVSEIGQQVSIGLVMVLLRLVQFALYVLLLVVLVKYGWKVVRYIWTK